MRHGGPDNIDYEEPNDDDSHDVFVSGQSISWTASERMRAMSTDCHHDVCRDKFECDLDVITQAQRVEALKQELEVLVDRDGLATILQALREICYDKANNIAVVWQDMVMAKLWIAYALHVNSVVQKINR